MALKIDLKQIGSTLDSIGSKTIAPVFNAGVDIMKLPFETMQSMVASITSNPMMYIMVGGVALIVLTKK